MKILLEEYKVEEGEEDIPNQQLRKIIHEITIDNGLRVINFATSKILRIFRQHLMERLPTKLITS
jgi:hypothetical protein